MGKIDKLLTLQYIYALFYGLGGLLFLCAGISTASTSLLGALIFGLFAIVFFGLAYISFIMKRET